jgi:ribokinase
MKHGPKRRSEVTIMAKICVVGSCNIDLTFHTSRLPRTGETVAGHDFRLGFGGKGANQAVMAARLGAEVRMVGRVGDDALGQQVLTALRQEGVKVADVPVTPNRPTGVAGIVVDAGAQNCIIVVPGANAELSADDVRGATAALRSADVVVAQLEVPLDAVAEAFARAGKGPITILNPAPARELPDRLLALTDLCVPNETELESLTGQGTRTLAEIEGAARALLRRGPRTVLVTLGERGALLVEANNVRHFPAMPVAAVDPTAAGDAFIGSLAVFLTERVPRKLEEAVQRAIAVAALTVTRPGAQASFPRRDEVEKFLAQQRK